MADIHGCALTFRALLEKVALTKEDQLFILGDLINRGPRSSEVVDHVMQLLTEGYEVHALRGNHEEILLHIAKTGPGELPLLLQPRNAMDMLNGRGKVKKRFLRYFRTLPYCFELDGFYLVHAGFNLRAVDPLTDLHAMVWQRPFVLKDSLVNGRRVVHGHQPRSMGRIRKMVEGGLPAICIDNGCTHGYMGEGYGALVCLDLDSGELWRKRNIDLRR
ncbi:MAG: serine/threonine protein phosphatase [Flavobacteriales bacterium]|nr:serine/threonine protein phosphatase [Flavobacteriales bacterium]